MSLPEDQLGQFLHEEPFFDHGFSTLLMADLVPWDLTFMFTLDESLAGTLWESLGNSIQSLMIDIDD